MLNVITFLKDNSPFLWNATRRLYIPSGLDPVGRPTFNEVLKRSNLRQTVSRALASNQECALKIS